MPLYFYETPLASSLMDIVLDSPPACKIPRKEQKAEEKTPWTVEMDVANFGADDLTLKLEGQQLVLEGKQKETKEGSAFERSFSRKWRLPRTVDVSSMKTELTDSTLKISAPRKPNSVEFPINLVKKATEKTNDLPLD